MLFHLSVIATFLILFEPNPTVSEDTQEFLNSDHLCSFCKCSTSTTTLTINCSNKSLERTIANWPETNATEIVATFSYNNMKSVKQFPGSNATIKLVLSHCNIEDMEPGLFESSINIYYLDLSYNKIRSDVLNANVFKGPYNNTNFEPISLEYLNLGFNEIHSLHRNIFEHMPNLKLLNLEGNNFRVIDDQTALAFANIPKLAVLNLAFNRLTDVSTNVLTNFPELTDLNLSNNDLDFMPLSLSLLKKLEVLILDNNPIRFLDEPSFLGLDDLLEVSAKNLTELTHIKTNTFAPCKKLQKLDLSHNVKLETIEAQAFLKSEKLKELHLTNTKINTLTVDILNWGELNVLELSHNQLYCDCNLYNISLLISQDIKRNKNGPYCRDIRGMRSLEVYNLTDEVCKNKPFNPQYLVSVHKTSPYLRLSLVLLTVVIIVSSFIAVILCYTKWKSWQRNQSYPFARQVIYNPITTNVHL
ncbi:chondroadherin [Onthophagus taurus]|uniref:chondroadherin n=1 Tax=Onthophagus taurus TaxID=166361 RepID=UPI0039BDE6CB